VLALNEAVKLIRLELPSPPAALWASVFFTLSVLTVLLSIAASQAFLALAGVFYALHLICHRPAVRFPPVALPLLLFCLLTVLSVVWAAYPAIGALAIRKLVLFLILLFTVNLITSPKHLETLYQALFCESAAAGLLAVKQFVSSYRAVRLTHPREIYYYMAYRQRVEGFMGHWMNFGGQQMLIFAVLAAFVLLKESRSKFWWGVLAIVGLSIVIGLTRGVWLGCFAAALYLISLWRPRLLWLVPVLAILAYLASPSLVRQRVRMAFHPAADMAVAERVEMWRVGLRMARAHPWLGVGADNIPAEYPFYMPSGRPPRVGYHDHLHNNLLQLAAERGIPAMIVWVWLMVAFAWHFRKLAQSTDASERFESGPERWIVHGVLAAWIAFVVEGFFDFNFGLSPVLMLFLFLAASPFVFTTTAVRRPSPASRNAAAG
jgi:putative inorganic carbon (HCO3(-)) transporter